MNVQISTEYIKLDQLLKFAGVSLSGADAKLLIQSGAVSVNGLPCDMRGKKLREGDEVTVALDDEILTLTVEQSHVY